jgi:Na+-transporting NADH:ubiquinone oxidoreductase subunit A
MSNQLDLKKGLDIPVKGVAARKVVQTVKPGVVAVKPTDFKGFLPRLLVKEGDRVLAGSPVLADKQRPRILVTSPVSGTVTGIVRGDKRKLLAVLVQADDFQEYVDFGAKIPANADQVKDLLLDTGLWNALIQRPYGIQADPDLKPKAIFVSSFSTAPLSADTEFTLGDRLDDIQAGVNALGKLTDGGVHLTVNKAVWNSSPFHKVENVIAHAVSGKHPAGNVGVQISHIAPIQKGETVWTMPVTLVAALGRVINTGRLDLTRKVAVTGPVVAEPAYAVALPGTPVRSLVDVPADARVVGGDVLTGENLGADGYLGFFQDQLTLLHEGTEREWFGWAKPFRPKVHSSSWCYFSWLTPNKKYDMDTNLHGGPRAFVETKCFEDVTPMDIFPIYLIKACLAGDIEKMEKFGIYEVLPEDLALCDYVDPSKNDIQAIIQQGIDLMIKEMA